MVPAEWLQPELILAQQDFVTAGTLLGRVAEKMAAATQLSHERILAALHEATSGEGYSIGDGVAIPHIELSELAETFVCLVTLRSPLPMRSIDGKPVNVVLFILSKPDPHAHLLLLAHLARLAQSRTFLEGLRRSQSAEEVVKLVQAAELRHKALRAVVPEAPRSSDSLFIISVGGEQMVDALLVDLVDLGFGEASVLEAQNLRQAAAHEVPLFAGFRDLFGDPGGRRVLIVEAETDRADLVFSAVKRVSEEHKSEDAHVAVIPIQSRWSMPKRADTVPTKEH